MRQVAITGMGIVSCIGNNKEEVLDSLQKGKSGITFSDEHRDLGFRSHVFGSPTLDPEEYLEKKARRFMGNGAAWNYIAMQQAIDDSGLEESDIINEQTGLIMGSGGPSTRALIEAADITRSKGPKRVGPFAVQKLCHQLILPLLQHHLELKELIILYLRLAQLHRTALEMHMK